MPADRRPAPRIFGLLARVGPTALLLRRGPSKRYCTVGWNRDDDRFTVGGWLDGRIYERRCDLSPDGSHLIYFAFGRRGPDEVAEPFTAIAETPELEPLCLWAWDSTWNGGGLFLDGRRFYLNVGYEEPEPRHVEPCFEREAEPPFDGPLYGEDGVLHLPRLRRDGWLDAPSGSGPARLVRQLPGGVVLGRRFGLEGGRQVERFELWGPDGGEVETADWQWAEWDGYRQRLVFARGGRILTGEWSGGELVARELFDLGPLEDPGRVG